MSTLTGIVATVVVQSSAAALSHFGLSLEPMRVEPSPPPAERVVARSHAVQQRVADCPERARARLDKV